MKATLIFDLSKEEEKDVYDLMISAPKYSSLIEDFENYLRNNIKYNEELTAKEKEFYNMIRDRWFEIKQENGL